MTQDYTYAVARIRYREARLLTDSDLNLLLSAANTENVIRILKEKGWGDASTDNDPESLLATEEQKLWQFIDEVVEDRSVFDFLLAPNDFHNLKVAVKAITRDIKPDDMFIPDSVCDPKKLYEALKRREYDDLPEHLRDIAREAVTVLLETSDGQLCDILIDKACMDYVYSLGKQSEDDIIRLWCELFVVSSDIRIAVRSAKTGKSRDFILRALADCDTLDIKRLANAAALSYDDVISYLGETVYSKAVEALSESMSAFEKWCDDSMTEALKPQKWEPFGVGPVVAYIIARQNEIKAARMILSAKVNALPEEIIRERLRMMYV